jgi:nucleotide-binding universal stress UspA family protein
MFNRILVPLDGSSRAQSVLKVASRLVRKTGGTLILLQVVSPIQELWPQMPAEFIGLTDAEQYLGALKKSADLDAIPTETIVQIGNPADVILSVAAEHHADLIIVCRHGYTDLTRWVLGSVSQKVVRYSTTPVLVLSEDRVGIPQVFIDTDKEHPLQIYVALDGSRLAEAILLPAMHLMMAFSSIETPGILHLVQVTKKPTIEEERLYQHQGIVIRDYRRREAEDYLQRVVHRVSQALSHVPGAQIVSSVIESDDVASALIQVSAPTENKHNLFALTTHVREGQQRWMVGSVAERVLENTQVPLFVVRPQEHPNYPLKEKMAVDQSTHETSTRTHT